MQHVKMFLDVMLIMMNHKLLICPEMCAAEELLILKAPYSWFGQCANGKLKTVFILKSTLTFNLLQTL